MLAAARRLFVANGYTATTVAEIAAEAGVAVQTVYSAVGSKAYLLIALIDQVVREDAGVHGIDADARAHEGAWPVLASGPRVRRAIMESGGDVIRLLVENTSDPDIKRAWQEVLSRAQGGAETAMLLLEEYGALRPGLDPAVAADQTGAIMHPAVILFLQDRGWTLEQIETWMLDTLARTLTTLEPPAEPRSDADP